MFTVFRQSRGVCGLNERSGMGFLPLEQLQLWRKPWHWLQAAADGSSLLVQLEAEAPEVSTCWPCRLAPFLQPKLRHCGSRECAAYWS